MTNSLKFINLIMKKEEKKTVAQDKVQSNTVGPLMATEVKNNTEPETGPRPEPKPDPESVVNSKKEFLSFAFIKFKLNENESALGIVISHNKQEEKFVVNVFTGETNPNKSPVKYLEVPSSAVTHFAAFELTEITKG